MTRPPSKNPVAQVTPARIDFGVDAEHTAHATPRSLDYDDIYRPPGDALAQAREVFLRGNHLPRRWQGRARFTILETGFGLGHNMLATIEAWRRDPHRCAHLHLVSIDKHPPRRADLERAWSTLPRGDVEPSTVTTLLATWPPSTPGTHRLRLAEGAVTLDLLFADVVDAMRAWVGAADAVFLDGFAPARNPAMWSPQVFRALDRVVAADATAATWSVARDVRDGLHPIGFDTTRESGHGAKRHRLEARRRALPEGRQRHDPLVRLGRAPSATPWIASADRAPGVDCDAIVIGAGLAGAHVAAALASRGLRCTVLERHEQPAQEASGGVAGIFHGTIHASDNLHARLYRAASLEAARTYRRVLAQAGGAVPGSVDGLLRQSDLDLDTMRAQVAAQGLPLEWISVLDPAQAGLVGGVPIERPCWFFPEAGWISPHALVRWLLAKDGITFLGGHAVGRIERIDDHWHATVTDGAASCGVAMPLHTRIRAPVCVLADASHACTLAPWARWPLHASRGQSTQLPVGTPGLLAPRIPVSSNGYALALPDGSVLCGASAHHADDEAAARTTDTRDNLDKLARLTGGRVDADTALARSTERVAWRSHTSDRMPIVGAVPARVRDHPPRQPQARHQPREPGLYVLTGLGSRGLTLAPLMADIVASSILREPLAVEAALLDAIDAARFAARTPA